MLLAGLYKNLGKLGEHEEFLEKALVLLKKGQEVSCLLIRWTLQLIAFKSSAKKYTDHNKARVVLLHGFQNPINVATTSRRDG